MGNLFPQMPVFVQRHLIPEHTTRVVTKVLEAKMVTKKRRFPPELHEVRHFYGPIVSRI